MNWSLEEAITYYQDIGKDQNTIINLLKEIQQENTNSIPLYVIPCIANAFGIKESFLLALIRRIPSLHLGDTHVLELCAGPNCGKHKDLADFALKLESKTVTVKFSPCMRLCGKGPNIKWDGKLYHQATPALLRQLIDDSPMG